MNNLGFLSAVRLHHLHPLGVLPSSQADLNNMALFGTNSATTGTHRSPSPECPSFEHMERKQKKPLMEKKRRARINACFDQLKEMLLHSEMQQNSKLEKADILEKTVQFVTLLQQQNARLLQQLRQLMQDTDPGKAFHHGVRQGVSLSVAATIDLLAGLPDPYKSPELLFRVHKEVPEKVAQAANLPPCGQHPCAPTSRTQSDITPQKQQQPQSKTVQRTSSTAPSTASKLPTAQLHPAPVPSHPHPPAPPSFIHSPFLWPFFAAQTGGALAIVGGPKAKEKEWEGGRGGGEGEEETKGGGEEEQQVDRDQHQTASPEPPEEEEEVVDVESVEGTNGSGGSPSTDEGRRTTEGKGEQDSGIQMFSEESESTGNGRKRRAQQNEQKQTRTTPARKRRRGDPCDGRGDGDIFMVESILKED